MMRLLSCCAAVLLSVFVPGWCQAEEKLPDGAKAHRDLAYVPDGHQRQKLDLYLPEEPKGPLLVWIHGGGWAAGSKDEAQGLQMLDQGYAVASLGYRFSQDALFPAQIQDCKAAIRWLRAHAKEYGYDSKRIAVWGASAGGHLTALLATTSGTKEFDVGENLDQSSAIQCGIDLFGPTDFLDWKAPTPLPIVQPTGKESLLVRLLGGTAVEKPELARKASPLVWAGKDAAPLYILHGTVDPLVGLEQSERLAEKLKKEGAEVVLDVVKDGGHGGKDFFDPQRLLKLLAFLDKHVGKK